MRKSFFDEPSEESQLRSRSSSPDPFDRWAAAVELGHVNLPWAIQLLWHLKTDIDENTRTAAKNSLKKYTHSEIERAVGEVVPSEIRASGQLHEWKIRPLPGLSDETVALFETVILDILATEGPTPGMRLFRLIGSSVNPNNKYVLSKNSLRKILKTLVTRNVIARNDFNIDSDDLETSNFYLTGQPDVVIRARGTRLLSEIPISEAKQVLRSDARAVRRADNSDFLFKVLANQYEISHLEYHVVGRLLEKEWLGLFSSETWK